MSSLSLAAIPHFAYQPIWVSLLFSLMIAWRSLAIWRHWPLPSRQYRYLSFLQWLIAVGAIVLMINSYGNFIGRDAGTALLIVMLGLKVIEVRNARDYYISCFLGYFLIVTNFLYSQSILTAVLMFVVIILMTTCLISLNDLKRRLKPKSQFKLASKMLLQAMPLMVVLFVLFPRITGPLWGLPPDAHTATTGISNKMTLGKISDLIQSDAVAFRVKFNDLTPPGEVLYWRGPVLWDTDGMTWGTLSSYPKKTLPKTAIQASGKQYNYTVTLEPHNKNWLFALDLPTNLPTSLMTVLAHDATLFSQEPIKQRVQYQLSSQTQFSLNAHGDALRHAALYLPQGLHPKTRALAEQWRQELALPAAIIEQALSHFNQNNFYYTLKPPLLKGDVIDDFLFGSRKGFCEHYAASFTVLMRAAGIPTRIVTGYQGGELNPVDGYWVVRQRDAHAWTEVWLDGRGWVRIDPTAAVSQDRIESGMSTLLTDTMRAPIFFDQNSDLIALWLTIRNNWDAVNNAWNHSILAYGPKLQKSFLSKLGMNNPDWRTMTITLFVVFSLIMLFTSVVMLTKRRKPDPVITLYQQFCQRFVKLGQTPRASHEGPVDFASRMAAALPEKAMEIDHITALYISLRYAQSSSGLRSFKHAVKHFNPK